MKVVIITRAHKFLLLFCILMYLGCQEKKVENTKDIQCILTLDKTNYNLGGRVFVNLSFRNNSNKDILICAWPSEEKMFFRHHANGKKNTTICDEIVFEKPTETKESFITLPAKEDVFFGSTELGDEYFKKTGKWNLKIIKEFNFTGKDLGVNAWTGIVESNIVDLSITAK